MSSNNFESHSGVNVDLHHLDATSFQDEDNSGFSGKRQRDSDEEQHKGKDNMAMGLSSFSTGGLKRPRNNIRGDNKLEIRIIIPVNTAGALIGKGGQNIKELRQEFNASIQLPNSEGYERVVTATAASLEDLSNFAGKVSKCLNELKQRMRPQEDCSIRILIHKSQAGTIIGIKGSRIKELRETTGAKIKVNQDCCPNSTDRICQVSGNQEVVSKCVLKVLELMQSAPAKGPQQNFDPSCIDDSYNYGGYNGFDQECPFATPLPRGRGPPRGDHPPMHHNAFNGPPPPFGGGRRGAGRFDAPFEDFNRRRNMAGGNNSGGNGGGGFSPSGAGGAAAGGNMNRMSGGRYPPDRQMRRGQRVAGPGPMRRPYRANMHEGDSFGEAFGDGFNRGGPNDMQQQQQPPQQQQQHQQQELCGNDIVGAQGGGERESTQVTIPTALAGSIIGVRGQRIRQIRQDSGANIKIEEELPGTKERIITIIGNSEQIQNAQYLLQKSVKLYSGERF